MLLVHETPELYPKLRSEQEGGNKYETHQLDPGSRRDFYAGACPRHGRLADVRSGGCHQRCSFAGIAASHRHWRNRNGYPYVNADGNNHKSHLFLVGLPLWDHYTNFRDTRSVDETIAILKKNGVVWYSPLITGLNTGDIEYGVYGRSETPAEAIEKVKEPWQALIDEANGK